MITEYCLNLQSSCACIWAVIWFHISKGKKSIFHFCLASTIGQSSNWPIIEAKRKIKNISTVKLCDESSLRLLLPELLHILNWIWKEAFWHIMSENINIYALCEGEIRRGSNTVQIMEILQHNCCSVLLSNLPERQRERPLQNEFSFSSQSYLVRWLKNRNES